MKSIIVVLSCVALTVAAFARPMQLIPNIPKTFDEQALPNLEVPLVVKSASPVQLPSEAYYSFPVAPVYKAYPIYHPSKEPPGYIDWLKEQEPEVVFDSNTFKTDEDWIRAGELVFDKPSAYAPLDPDPSNQDVRNPRWYEATGMPLPKDGILPFMTY